MLHSKKILPVSSYIPFEVRKIKRPNLLWSNRISGESEDQLLDKYAYCAPLDGEPEDTYTSEGKIAHIERYGGSGIGVNGGGVRCGMFDGMTVKGIGKSQLAGTTAPFWHSYGGASIKEAIREVIWGEVFDSALPFGAVRVEAIIATGTSVPLRYVDAYGNNSCSRALILRKPFIRPAHYMRASFFQPSSKFSSTYLSDSERTQVALSTIFDALRSSLNILSINDFYFLLRTAFLRYASQIAIARAKRLIHGSISSSNITLDGRILDFGMTSSVSDFGRIIIARGCPDATQQHHGIINTLVELGYYLNRYNPQLIKSRKNWQRDIREHFMCEYENAFRIQLIKLSGFPESAIEALSFIEKLNFSNILIEIISEGNCEPFKILSPCDKYKPSMPDTMGKYNLRSILIKASELADSSTADEALKPLIFDNSLRERFIKEYFNIYSIVRNFMQANDKEIRIFIKLNAKRINSDLSSLYSFNLNNKIDAEISEGKSVGKFIDKIISKIIFRVKDLENDTIYFKYDGEIIKANPLLGILRSGQAINPNDYLEFSKNIDF